jgi:hypothetical protein
LITIKRAAVTAAGTLFAVGVVVTTASPAAMAARTSGGSRTLCDVVTSGSPTFGTATQGISNYGTPYTSPIIKTYEGVRIYLFSHYTQLKRISSTNPGIIEIGHAYLAMQPGGDLQLFADPFNLSAGCYAWHTDTGGHAGAYLRFQPDGNLVVYSSSNVALWASSTCCNSAITGFAVQGDGNLVLYTSSGGVAWTSNTNVP